MIEDISLEKKYYVGKLIFDTKNVKDIFITIKLTKRQAKAGAIKQFQVNRRYINNTNEDYYYKKKLMDNNWDMNALKTMISLRIDINKKLDLNKEYPVKLNYCPKCRRKLKNKEKECPYCGIDIKDYLYNN